MEWVLCCIWYLFNLKIHCKWAYTKSIYIYTIWLCTSDHTHNFFFVLFLLIGIISSECPLLNYFLLIAKLYLWDCRRSQILPSLAGFKMKIKIKFETEKYICPKNKTTPRFQKFQKKFQKQEKNGSSFPRRESIHWDRNWTYPPAFIRRKKIQAILAHSYRMHLVHKIISIHTYL